MKPFKATKVMFFMITLISLFGLTKAFARAEFESITAIAPNVFIGQNKSSLLESMYLIAKEGETTAKIYAPLREFSAELGYIVDWSSEENSIQLFPKVVSSHEDGDDFFSNPMPLIAAACEEDTYLYNLRPNGAVLTHHAISKAFEWSCFSSRYISPQLKVFDYDLDGQKDIAISLNNGSGTGVNIDELHIVKVSGENLSGYPEPYDADLTDYKFERENIYEQLQDKIDYQIYESVDGVLISIKSQNNSVLFNLKDAYAEIRNSDNLEFIFHIDNLTFTLQEDGKIVLNTLASVVMPDNVAPYDIANITADVLFFDNIFEISNIKLDIT